MLDVAPIESLLIELVYDGPDVITETLHNPLRRHARIHDVSALLKAKFKARVENLVEPVNQ